MCHIPGAVRHACGKEAFRAQPAGIAFPAGQTGGIGLIAGHGHGVVHAMLDAGVYLAPSAFEAGFASAAHSDADIAATSAAADAIFAAG